MTEDVVSTPADADLASCLRTLGERGFRSMPVVADGEVVGLLTEARAAALAATLGKGTARDAMSTDMVIARPNDMMADVLQRSQWAMQEAVVVLEGNKLAGILTESDAVKHAARVLPEDVSVEDHANTSLVCIDADRPAKEAFDRLRRSFLHDLVVLDDRVLHGMLSVRDLVAARVDERAELTCGDLVRDVARQGGSSGAATVRWDTPLKKAAELMVEHDVGCVPVLSDDGRRRVEAVVSRGDVIRALVASGEVGEGDKSIEDVLL